MNIKLRTIELTAIKPTLIDLMALSHRYTETNLVARKYKDWKKKTEKKFDIQ